MLRLEEEETLYHFVVITFGRLLLILISCLETSRKLWNDQPNLFSCLLEMKVSILLTETSHRLFHRLLVDESKSYTGNHFIAGEINKHKGYIWKNYCSNWHHCTDFNKISLKLWVVVWDSTCHYKRTTPGSHSTQLHHRCFPWCWESTSVENNKSIYKQKPFDLDW